MNKARIKQLLPIILLFVAVTALGVVGRDLLQSKGLDTGVLLVGNLVLFVVTFLSFAMALRGLANPNPHAFVRSVYSSMMMKLFLCAIGAFVYISMAGKDLNKPALFACMGLYLVYTFMEVSVLTQLLKQKPNV